MWNENSVTPCSHWHFPTPCCLPWVIILTFLNQECFRVSLNLISIKWTLDNFRIWIKFLHFPNNNLPNCGPCFSYLLWSHYLSLSTPAGSHYLSLAITDCCGLRTAPCCSWGLCIMWLLLCVPWSSCLASMPYLLEFGFWLFSVPLRSIHKSLTSSVMSWEVEPGSLEGCSQRWPWDHGSGL